MKTELVLWEIVTICILSGKHKCNYLRGRHLSTGVWKTRKLYPKAKSARRSQISWICLRVIASGYLKLEPMGRFTKSLSGHRVLLKMIFLLPFCLFNSIHVFLIGKFQWKSSRIWKQQYWPKQTRTRGNGISDRKIKSVWWGWEEKNVCGLRALQIAPIHWGIEVPG